MASLKRLGELEGDYQVLPGHDTFTSLDPYIFSAGRPHLPHGHSGRGSERWPEHPGCPSSPVLGFTGAARPETAIPLYERFMAQCEQRGFHVEHGEFGADMQVFSPPESRRRSSR